MVSLKYEKGVVQNPINHSSVLAFENCIAPQCFMVTRYTAAFHKATDTKKNVPYRMQLMGKKIFEAFSVLVFWGFWFCLFFPP